MRAMDTRLQEQVTTMQAAQGEAKLDAIAQVVATLAEQRPQMRQQMMAMDEQMMSHMMSHGRQGSAGVQQCLMMQRMQEPTKDGAAHQH
jgi:hypothetical protein